MDHNAIQVLRLSCCDLKAVAGLLDRYGMTLVICPGDEPIKGSFWGDEEAGLVGRRLLARLDTPLHSILHEAGHYICMDESRRIALDTDAGGDYEEENAVCYLQILLADVLPKTGREQMFKDMDAWGYSFRLGSARAWFEQDAQDARQWLIGRGIIRSGGKPTFRMRLN